MKKTVAIIGLGLMGGSLGQALRRSKRYRVLGFSRRASTRRQALQLGAVDRISTDYADLRQAQIIVIGTPVDLILPTIKAILPYCAPGAWIIDVGSVKGVIVEGAARLIKGWPVHFVGAHPLAGSHKMGVKAARSDLYRGSTCVLVPAQKLKLGPVPALWRAVGARVVNLSAADHDAALAVTSHLPHVVAHALVHVLAGRPNRELLKKLTAGSFRDGTRVASADPEQWVQIFRANAPALRRALHEFRGQLDRLERLLDRPGLAAHLQKSQRLRQPLFHGI